MRWAAYLGAPDHGDLFCVTESGRLIVALTMEEVVDLTKEIIDLTNESTDDDSEDSESSDSTDSSGGSLEFVFSDPNAVEWKGRLYRKSYLEFLRNVEVHSLTSDPWMLERGYRWYVFLFDCCVFEAV